MKDVFGKRLLDNFVSLHRDFIDSLVESLPAEEVGAWLEKTRARLDAAPEEVVREWHARLASPLRKQHARYVRAIASITGADACVYHAVAYKDGDALDACECNPLGTLTLATCTRHVTESEDVRLLWRYLSELSDSAYRWAGEAPPSVPSPEAIAEDIETRRRRTTGAPAPSAAPPAACGLVAGIDDLWRQLAQRRGATPETLDEAGRARLQRLLSSETITSEAATAALPELAGGGALAPEDLQLLERMRQLQTMNDAIPSDMMRGIESVASQLVQDINSGRCDLASLDIERIGQQVIQGVSDDDMGTFAANLDKIIPALQRAHQPPPAPSPR